METFPRVIFRNKTGGKEMKCEICGKNKASALYHRRELCLDCYRFMLEEDKGKRRLLLKQKGEAGK